MTDRDPSAAERGKHPLIGMIVSWRHICATKRKPGRAPGHGEVVAMVGEQLILVRTIREDAEDTEPDHMLVLQLTPVYCSSTTRLNGERGGIG